MAIDRQPSTTGHNWVDSKQRPVTWNAHSLCQLRVPVWESHRVKDIGHIWTVLTPGETYVSVALAVDYLILSDLVSSSRFSETSVESGPDQ